MQKDTRSGAKEIKLYTVHSPYLFSPVIWYLVAKLTAFGEIFPDPITVLANIGDKFVNPAGKVTHGPVTFWFRSAV